MGQVGHSLVRTGLPPSSAGAPVDVPTVGPEEAVVDTNAGEGSILSASSEGVSTAPKPVSEFRLINSRRDTFLFNMVLRV